MLYNIIIIYWPYRKYIYFRVVLWLKAQGLEPKVKPWIRLITRKLNGVSSIRYQPYIQYYTTVPSLP